MTGMTVISYSQWIDSGRTRAALRAAVASGEVVRLRRGVVAEPGDPGAASLHRLRILGAAPVLGPSTFFGHESAAVLHGLPLLTNRLDEVVAVRAGGGHGAITATLHARTAKLGGDDVTLVDGLPVTNLDRTVCDLARRLPFPEAVMVTDAGLRLGADRTELLARCAAGRGCRMAERAVLFGDPLAESPGESLSRVRFHQARLPVPELQHEVFDHDGELVGRLDFWWRDQGLAGEFDGLVKYGRLLRPGESVEQVVLAEKRREQRLFDLGIRVIRWTWSDLWSPALTARVAAALQRPDAVPRASLVAEGSLQGAGPRR